MILITAFRQSSTAFEYISMASSTSPSSSSSRASRRRKFALLSSVFPPSFSMCLFSDKTVNRKKRYIFIWKLDSVDITWNKYIYKISCIVVKASL